MADVAFEAGFGSVDGYQRAFYRAFGCNPRQYAAHPVPLYLFNPYGVKYREMERKPMMESVKNVFVRLVEKPARNVVIKRGVHAADYFAYCEEVGCDVWGLLRSIRGLGASRSVSGCPTLISRPAPPAMCRASRWRRGRRSRRPEGFDVIRLPAAEYLMFQGEPFAEEDYCQAIEEVQAAMKKFDPSGMGYVWDESNPRIQLEPFGVRGYIELCAGVQKTAVAPAEPSSGHGGQAAPAGPARKTKQKTGAASSFWIGGPGFYSFISAAHIVRGGGRTGVQGVVGPRPLAGALFSKYRPALPPRRARLGPLRRAGEQPAPRAARQGPAAPAPRTGGRARQSSLA